MKKVLDRVAAGILIVTGGLFGCTPLNINYAPELTTLYTLEKKQDFSQIESKNEYQKKDIRPTKSRLQGYEQFLF